MAQGIEAVNDEIVTRIERMAPGDLQLLEKNARYMRHETYQRLVENLKHDGKLTSVPFVFKDGEGYTVLSGNHRVQAAIDAGIEEIDVMVTDTALSRSQQVAIQLSHNSLSGEDNLSLLKSLYEEMDGVDWRLYSGLDDKTLELMGEVEVPSMNEANLSYTIVPIVFLPNELEAAKEAFSEAKTLITGDEAWLASWGEYDALLDGLAAASAAYNVGNIATSLAVILGVFERHQDDLSEGWYGDGDEPKHNDWVPLASILNTYDVPAPAAQVIRKAVLKMRDRGEVSSKALWQSLEMWAADYLAGE